MIAEPPRLPGHDRIAATKVPRRTAARGMVGGLPESDDLFTDEVCVGGCEVRVTILTACLSCGTPARSAASTFCARCGLPFGAAPPAHVELPSCPVCYRLADDDGRFPSTSLPGLRLDLPHHFTEHDQHPVGDDEYLESLREGSRIRIGRWTAPFDLVRRYLVTGTLGGGRRRQFEHDLIVTAMTQLARFGRDAVILGDQPTWQAARDAVSDLLERYHHPLRGRTA